MPESTIRKRADVGGWVRTQLQGAHQVQPPAHELKQAPPRESHVAPGEPVELGQDLAFRMLQELDGLTANLGAIEDAIHEETRDDQNGRRRRAMLQAVSLPTRALTLKTIARALAVLREADLGARKGKKQQREENAQKAATGRFATPAPPKLVVNNEE